jgi:fibronectin type 3 domain-containing protein
MTFRKHVMISIVLLSISGLLLGCSSDDTTLAPTATDEAPPAAVSGLTATLTSSGDVALRWDASTQPNLRGYNVYRHNPSQSAIGTLNASPLTDNRYVDTGAQSDAVYEYMVTAVSARGLESAFTTVTISTSRTNVKDTGREID